MSRLNARAVAPRATTTPASAVKAVVIGLNLMFWAGCTVGIVFGLPKLEYYARTWTPAQSISIQWVNLPNWLQERANKEVLIEIEQLTQLRTTDDLNDPQLCERVAANLLDVSKPAASWIERLNRVEKVLGHGGGGLVRIDATFREPLGSIVWKDRAYLIDQDGVVLPRDHKASQLQPDQWFIITGVSQPPTHLGEVWPGDDVQAGVKLVRFLKQSRAAGRLPFRDVIKAVDVANFHRKVDKFAGRLRIQVYGPGSYIYWGEPPGEEYDVDGEGTTAARKLDMLLQVYQRNGQLPMCDWIDVRYSDGIRFSGAR